MANKCFVYLDFAFNNVKAGRVVIELFSDVVPKTTENFRALCTGEKEIGSQGKLLHFKGSTIHRVISQCMVQGGDIINGDGTGGESIYGEYFPEENFTLKHAEPGIVGMSPNGRNKNSSQFYITTVPCTHLDNTNVAFGKVVRGLDVIIEMSEIPRVNDVPQQNIVISNCGEFQLNVPWNLGENDGTVDVYPPWPSDWDEPDVDDEFITRVINNINDSGNVFYYKQKFLDSERKYKKVIRYIDWYLEKTKHTESRNAISKLRNNALLNLTAVRLKINKNKEAVEHCNEILKSCPDNGKAYYRRGRAKLALKEYDDALKDLKIAYKIHPNDKHIKNTFEVAKNRKRTYLTKERVFFAKIFNQ